jgi:undecaprenyl-diphosphatase
MLRPISWDAVREGALKEIGALIAVCVVALGLLGFAGVADEAGEGDTHGFDHSLLLALRNPADQADPIGPPWVEHAIGDITSLGGYAVLTLLTIGVAAYLHAIGKHGWALLVAGAIAGGALVSEGLKMVFARARPDIVTHLAEVQSASFPSGHAMLSAVAYLTLGALLARAHRSKRVKALVMGAAILLTVLVGVSRVYLGVHWPTDVLAGWCVGAAWAALCWLAAWALQREGAVEAEAT